MGMGSLLVFLLLCVASSAVSSPLLPILAGDGKPSAYEVLETYNFPIGLLPKGCLGYGLDQATGEFSAYFDGACGFSLEGSYQLHYESTISGRISNGRLSDLRGVSVKILFFWVNIIEVTRDGDQLRFSVGIASAGFPIDNFYESPQCGCGLVCDGASSSPLRMTS